MLAFFGACASLSPANAEVRILYAESVVIDVAPILEDADRKEASAEPHALDFDAFGRHFKLTLRPNADLNRLGALNNASAFALRGEIAGASNSWVRLTRANGRISGLMFDGKELYAIEPASEVPSLQKPGTAIFRLADTVADASTLTCAADAAESTNAATFYDRLKSELKAQGGVSHRLRLSAILDAQFLQRFGASAVDAAITRLNNVDGIFAEQVGLTLEVAALNQTLAIGPQLSASTSANALLDSLGNVRSSDPSLYGTGVTHLFTGRDLDGNTIGLSYIGAVCDRRYAATLSESRDRGTWLDSLIAAHELGHSFGAQHDGTGECAATTPAFLMAPSIAGWDQFSQCSLNRIQATMSQAQCLTPLPRGDIALAAQFGERTETPNRVFNWSLQVANVGQADIATGLVSLNVPAALQVVMAMASNSSCTVGGGIVECTVAALAPNELRAVTLELRGAAIGAYDITATVSALGDASLENNSGTGRVTISDIASTPTPASGSAPTPGASTSSPSAEAAEGGGGMLSYWVLLSLGGLLSRRRQFR